MQQVTAVVVFPKLKLTPFLCCRCLFRLADLLPYCSISVLFLSSISVIQGKSVAGYIGPPVRCSRENSSPFTQSPVSFSMSRGVSLHCACAFLVSGAPVFCQLLGDNYWPCAAKALSMSISVALVPLLGSFSKPRRRRRRECHQTKGLMSRTIAVHVRFESLYISLPSSAKQKREMTKFCVFWTTRTATANFSYLLLELNPLGTRLTRARFWTDRRTEQIYTVAKFDGKI